MYRSTYMPNRPPKSNQINIKALPKTIGIRNDLRTVVLWRCLLFILAIRLNRTLSNQAMTMPLLCLTMSARAKLAVGADSVVSFQRPSFVLQHYRTLHETNRSNIQQWRISGKPSSSLALVANERIRPNDGHAQRKSQASHALVGGTTLSRRIWRLPGAANHTRCIFFQSQRNWRMI